MSNPSCISGKRYFEDKPLAEEALVQYRIRNELSEEQGPVNVYHCEDCGGWHFTSKGEKSLILLDEDVKDRIRKERIALHWERKLL